MTTSDPVRASSSPQLRSLFVSSEVCLDKKKRSYDHKPSSSGPDDEWVRSLIDQAVSKNHEKIEQMLQPMVASLTQVQGSLTQVQGSLTQVQGSLAQAQGSLTQVQGSLKQLQSGLILTLPTIFSEDVGGLVRTGSVLRGTSATYTWIEHGGKYYVLGAAHCAYYYGKSLNPCDRFQFVQLPLQVIEAEVQAIYRHKDLANGSPTWHDFVIVEVKNPPPEDVSKPIPTQWPLPPKEWLAKNLLEKGVFGRSSSGPVGGTHLAVDEAEKVGVFLEVNGEPGHSGTLLYSAESKQPLGVYVGPHRLSKHHRPRGICVPVPCPDCAELKLTKPWHQLSPEKEVQYSAMVKVREKKRVRDQPVTYELRQYETYCEILDKGKAWPGLLVEDGHSFQGRPVSGWPCQVK